MLANLEVKWLYDVIALEESRSFTLAAKARNISQSSFSRRIQSLEASLGKFLSAMREICSMTWIFRSAVLKA